MPNRNLALFDLDNTLLPFDSDHAWGEFCVHLGWTDGPKHRQTNDRFYADYKAGTLDLDAYLRFSLAPLVGRPPEVLANAHRDFMHQVVLPQIRPSALELVRKHQQAGDLCCIVTATNDFVTQPIAEAFGVPHLIAVQTERDALGRYTGGWHGVPSFREGKIIRTTQWLAAQKLDWSHFDQTWFYSDSINDQPLLEHVTHPVVVHPDPRLAELARERGWPVLELFP
ncbi:HAD family hydrolase [Thiomonas sp.]|uniref:histidinol-phosphatase n=1 Tax=Thiomonas sp. TaxID=2047785 RepID=UPI000BC955AC|nr:HAD family hydrolase [Thiomonas sp.]OZB50909.1 MAG: phosphoserine phosphatase [Thiomonas sp. 14-66-4]